MSIPHETGLKKKQRGWYADPDPGLKDLRGKFEDADRTNGTMKLAEIALRDVLRKFALFQDAPDPVRAFVKVLGSSNFGYGDPAKRPTTEQEQFFGPGVPMNSGYGDQAGATNETYGGV